MRLIRAIQMSCVLIACLFSFIYFANSVWAQIPIPEPIETPTPTPPYLEIGNTYQSSGDLTKASEYYLKAIEADPSNAQALNQLKQTIRRENSILDQPFIKFREILASIVDIVLAGILWAILIFVLFLIFKVISIFNQYMAKKESEKRHKFVVYPFTNGTGADGLKDIEHSVQAVLVDCLATFGAYIDVTKSNEPSLEIQTLSMDDLDTSPIKLIAWISKSVRRKPVVAHVEGTLLTPSTVQTSQGDHEAVGLQVRFKKTGIKEKPEIRIFWADKPHNGNMANKYISLARQAAAWLYHYPESPPTTIASEIIYTAMRVRIVGKDDPDSIPKANNLFNEANKKERETLEPAKGVIASGGERFSGIENLSTAGSDLAQQLSDMLAPRNQTVTGDR